MLDGHDHCTTHVTNTNGELLSISIRFLNQSLSSHFLLLSFLHSLSFDQEFSEKIIVRHQIDFYVTQTFISVIYSLKFENSLEH